jgi:membrane-associated protease RseP (regulator of RpoE activity)
VRVQEITKELQEARDLPTSKGALVNSVEPGSPADQAGLKRWDLIVELDREQIDAPTDLIRKVRSMDPGERVSITVLRNGDRRTFPITLATRPKDSGMGAMPPGFGGSTFNNNSEMQRQIDRLEQELSQLREQDQRIEREIRDLRDQIQGRDQDQDRSRGDEGRSD